jgi:plastocyanin
MTSRSGNQARCLWAAGLLALCLHGSILRSETPATAPIEGTVYYQSDQARPWRYARYYVKDPRQGELAEAVVALSGPTLQRPPVQSKEAAVIDQKNFQFIPETVALQAGQSVKFLNGDKELHNVNTSHLKHSFNVVMPSGGEHVEKFEYAGGIVRPYRIGCVYHSAMRSWIFVFDHPWFQVTGADGRFRLTGVPPGKYKLEMSHPAGELRYSGTVEVAAGQTVRTEIRVSADDKGNKP